VKGQGVIYTMTLVPPRRDPRPAPPPAAAPRLSDWERTRKQLRGEKLESPAKPSESREPGLADTLLKVLAENGQHFSQVPPEENITVVVTFRDLAGSHLTSCTQCHEAGQRPNKVDVGRIWMEFHTDPKFRPVGEEWTPESKALRDTQGDIHTQNWQQLFSRANVARPAADDQELLGDLHMKQSKYKEAIEAYRKAVEQNPRNESALRKLAQAYLAQGDYDKAKQSIDRAVEWLKKQQGAPAEAKPPSPARLPDKLIISAPKKLLDQVGTGMITFEEFKKAATVEYVTFPPVVEKK
jgi:hypothetical protein